MSCWLNAEHIRRVGDTTGLIPLPLTAITRGVHRELGVPCFMHGQNTVRFTINSYEINSSRERLMSCFAGLKSRYLISLPKALGKLQIGFVPYKK